MKAILRNEWTTRLMAWVLGGVFVYAAWPKIRDPQAFADSIATFQILPAVMITPIALSLPILELALGAGLILGIRRRGCASLVLVLCVLFALLLTQAWMRGLEVDCGCFGSGPVSTSKPVWALLRDGVFGAFAWAVAGGRKMHD